VKKKMHVRLKNYTFFESLMLLHYWEGFDFCYSAMTPDPDPEKHSRQK